MKSNYRWALIVTLLAFVLSLVLTLAVDAILENVTLVLSVGVTFLFILLGIIFDIIGVASTTSDVEVFHSMSAKRIRGGKAGVKLIKNASKVSSVCCDVVGDICGIISGAAGVTIVSLLVIKTNFNPLMVSLIVTSLISSLTIGGKALGKNLAIYKGNTVIKVVAKIISIFTKR